MSIEGVALNSIPSHPRIRRGVPKPFQRPALDLSGSIKRDWRTTPVRTLAVGDTVAEFGIIDAITTDEVTVTLTGGQGGSRRYPRDHPVLAFTVINDAVVTRG